MSTHTPQHIWSCLHSMNACITDTIALLLYILTSSFSMETSCKFDLKPSREEHTAGASHILHTLTSTRLYFNPSAYSHGSKLININLFRENSRTYQLPRCSSNSNKTAAIAVCTHADNIPVLSHEPHCPLPLPAASHGRVDGHMTQRSPVRLHVIRDGRKTRPSLPSPCPGRCTGCRAAAAAVQLVPCRPHVDLVARLCAGASGGGVRVTASRRRPRPQTERSVFSRRPADQCDSYIYIAFSFLSFHRDRSGEK